MKGITAAFLWCHGLRKNPVYLREKGVWGNPNPFYQRVAAFTPLVVIAGLVLGLCTVPTGLFPLTTANETFFIIYCFLCLPAVLLQTLTWLGVFLAPALTATSISREIDRGSWEILRLTPQSARSIVGAKLFGGLARLYIWPLIWLLSLIQALAVGAGFLLSGPGYNWLWAMPLGVSSLLRPSLEIFLAGLLGITISVWVRSAIMALVTTYGLLLLFKLTVWIMGWLMLSLAVAFFGDNLAALYYLMPTAVYLVAILVIMLVLTLSLRQWL